MRTSDFSIIYPVKNYESVSERHGGLMVSVPDSKSSNRSSSPGQGTSLYTWASQITLMVSLSSHRCIYLLLTKFEGHTVNYGPHFSPSILWGVVTLLVASCYRNLNKLQPDWPLGSYADFTFTQPMNTFKELKD